MKLAKLRIEIELPEPVRLLHLSDTHLALADGRDNERKRQLASRRTADFAVGGCNPRKHLEEALAYAKEHAELIVHTLGAKGITSVSPAKIEQCCQL